MSAAGWVVAVLIGAPLVLTAGLLVTGRWWS